MPNEHQYQAVGDRVQRSLQRLGYDNCEVQAVQDGQVRLTMPETNRDDQCLIQAALRLIPGIQSVVFVIDPKEANKP